MKSRGFGRLVALCFVLMASTAGMGQQLLFSDHTQTWETRGSWGADNDAWPPDAGVDNFGKHGLTDPHIYGKITVTGRPTTDELCVWLCLWNSSKDVNEVCAMEGRPVKDGSGTKFPCYSVTNDGSYYFDFKRLLAWPASHSGSWVYDVDMPLYRVLPQFRINGAKLHLDASKGHVPFDAHFELLAVQEGTAIAAPDGWDCPAEWNCGVQTQAKAYAQSRIKSGFQVMQTSGSIVVKTKGVGRIALLDLKGRALRAMHSMQGGTCSIDVSSLTAGTYVVSVHGHEGSFSELLAIE